MIARLVATCLGLGFLPGAPGTWASVAAIPLAWGLHAIGGFALVASFTVALAAMGYWSANEILRQQPADGPGGADGDPSWVVVDEVVGMMIALWPLSLGLTLMRAEWHVWPWPGWVLGFLLFRFFDIVKPPPVSWADAMPGALGIMLDDIVAGLLTAALALIAAGIAHGWF